MHREAVVADLQRSFGAGEEEALGIFATGYLVYTQAEIEALRVVKQGQHHVGNIASVFPVAQATGSHGPCGSVRPGDEVRSAEQMNEEITSHAGAVVRPLAPLEEALGVPGKLRGRTEKAWPVAGLKAGVRWDGVTPGSHSGAAIPARGNQVQFSDRSRS